MRVLTLALALSLGACVTTKTPEQLNWQPNHEAIVERVKAGLKDPMSAQFGKVTNSIVVYEPTGQEWVRAVCLTVNAKNSYGGYTGFKGRVIFQDGSEYIEGGNVGGSLYWGYCTGDKS